MFTLLSSLRRSLKTGRAPRSNRLGQRRPRPEIEALEARDTPSTLYIDQAHVLHLQGDNLNNTYTLDHVSSPVVTPPIHILTVPPGTPLPTGQSYTLLDGYAIADSAYSSVEIDTGSGSDVINIEATLAGKTVTIVEQGYGSMIVNLAPSSENLSNIQGDVTVDANYGTDSINLYDQNYGGNRTYTITANTVTWGNHAMLHYNDYQNFYQNYVVLKGGYGNDTFNVQSTSGAVPTAYTITETGFGDDTVNFAPGSQDLNSIQGPVTVHGNYGNDTLVVFDQYNYGSHTYTMTADTISRDGMSTITYDGMNSVVIYGCYGDATFDVLSTPNTGYTILTINETGYGRDTVNVGQGYLSQISGLTINGNYGYDKIICHDEYAYYPDTYVVTNNELTDYGSIAINYSGQNEVDIETNPYSYVANDAYFMQVYENGFPVF